MIHPRSFQARISGVLTLLLLVVIGCLYFAVRQAIETAVTQRANEQLEVGARVFERVMDSRIHQLVDGVTVLASDYGFRAAVFDGDVPTLRSALFNHGARINASETFLLDTDGRVQASTTPAVVEGNLFRFPPRLEQHDNVNSRTYLVSLEGEPHLMVEAPIMAPIAVARVVMGFRLDSAFVGELRSLVGLEVSLLTLSADGQASMISSLALNLDDQQRIEQMIRGDRLPPLIQSLSLDGERLLSVARPLSVNDDTQVVALLHTSLDGALRAFSPLDHNILLISLVALLVSLLGALLLARNLAQPVRQLVHQAERVGEGDYVIPVELHRRDELGTLAQAFRHMQEAIAQRERLLAHNALHDAQTGLPNRGLALERIEAELAAARPLALLCVGVRNLAELRQALAGSGQEERLMVDLARRLKLSLRAGDSLARVSAGEFLMLLEGADGDYAVSLGYSLQPMLQQPLRMDGHELELACNLGIAAYPEDSASAEELLRRAVIAMHDADGVSGGLRRYREGSDQEQRRQLELIRDLRQAPQQGGLALVYQPKLPLHGPFQAQAEALLRWTHPVHGFISPGEFIPLAERTGSVTLLSRWVIEEAIRQLAEWQQRGLVVKVSVNLSAEDLQGDALAEWICARLEQAQVPVERLTLEITESALPRDQQLAANTLQALRERGLRLSVDDFGTGYSSLAQLKGMPVQELKIDQSFIRELDDTCVDAVIVRSTIDMAHALGLEVVAEGIEHEHSLALLRQWGCDTAQGYLLSRPIAAAAFEAWASERYPSPVVES